MDYPLKGKVSEKVRTRLNQLYEKKKFSKIADFLKEINHCDPENLTIFLKEVLLHAPEQVGSFLRKWKFSLGDFYNITCYSAPYIYEKVLKTLSADRRLELAHVMGDAIPAMCDFSEKLPLLLTYQACDQAFWDVMVYHGTENFRDDKCLNGWNVFDECLEQITKLKDVVGEKVCVEFRTSVLKFGNAKMHEQMAEKMSDEDWYTLFLIVSGLERDEIHRNYMKILMNNSPTASVAEILPDWNLYAEDFEIIAKCSNIENYRAAMQVMDWSERTRLALEYKSLVTPDEKMERLETILVYEAYSARFWDNILGMYGSDEALSFILKWLNEHVKDPFKRVSIKKLEEKILAQENLEHLEILLPYLSEDGWMRLSYKQFCRALVCMRPPKDVIINYMDPEWEGEIRWKELCSLYELNDEEIPYLFSKKHFDAFKVYISRRRLSPEYERKIYSDAEYKQHRAEYQKQYKLLFYKRIQYWLGY